MFYSVVRCLHLAKKVELLIILMGAMVNVECYAVMLKPVLWVSILCWRCPNSPSSFFVWGYFGQAISGEFGQCV